jgi:hypothetical protein
MDLVVVLVEMVHLTLAVLAEHMDILVVLLVVGLHTLVVAAVAVLVVMEEEELVQTLLVKQEEPVDLVLHILDLVEL